MRLAALGAEATIEQLYPSMFSIHDLPDTLAMPDGHTGWIPMPLGMRPSYTSMESHGVYLIGELFHLDLASRFTWIHPAFRRGR